MEVHKVWLVLDRFSLFTEAEANSGCQCSLMLCNRWTHLVQTYFGVCIFPSVAHPVFCNLLQDHPGADRSGRCRLERKASRHSPGASVSPAAPQRGAAQRGGPESASREGSQGRRSVEKEGNLRGTAWESAISNQHHFILSSREKSRSPVRESETGGEWLCEEGPVPGRSGEVHRMP